MWLWLFLLSQVDTKLFEVHCMNWNIYIYIYYMFPKQLWLLLCNKEFGASSYCTLIHPQLFMERVFRVRRAVGVSVGGGERAVLERHLLLLVGLVGLKRQ